MALKIRSHVVVTLYIIIYSCIHKKFCCRIKSQKYKRAGNYKKKGSYPGKKSGIGARTRK